MAETKNVITLVPKLVTNDLYREAAAFVDGAAEATDEQRARFKAAFLAVWDRVTGGTIHSMLYRLDSYDDLKARLELAEATISTLTEEKELAEKFYIQEREELLKENKMLQELEKRVSVLEEQSSDVK